jgi:hypothetical protein
MRGALVSALGITILLGTPLLAQADQGKWWKPKEGDRRVETRDRGNQGGRPQADRGNQGGRGGWSGRRDASGGGAWRGGPAGGTDIRFRGQVQGGSGWSGGNIAYRDRNIGGRASWGGVSTWRGAPVRRDIMRIQDRRYGGGFFRARRIYSAPRYYGRFVYVRPVRYYIGADALIGGFGIHARIVRPHYIYACNFCDEQFDSYDAYAAHVEHCHYRPSGFGISVSNWDDDYGATWDGPYPADDTYDNYHGNGAYDDQGYDQGYDQNDPGYNDNSQGYDQDDDQGGNGYNDR